MSTYSRIKELAAEIQFQTTVLDAKLSDLGLPSPTFEASMIDELPPVLHAVQKSILEAADELTLLVRGPVQNLMHLGIYSVSILQFPVTVRIDMKSTNVKIICIAQRLELFACHRTI
jgi:hypothetical protein